MRWLGISRARHPPSAGGLLPFRILYLFRFSEIGIQKIHVPNVEISER